MKILIDTNIILDVLCARDKFLENSSKVWKLCETNQVEGYISALSIPNIVYILRKELTPEKTKDIIQQILLIFKIVDLRSEDLKRASDMLLSDYEDAIQIACATRIHADYIITRNVKDFKESNILAVTPTQWIGVLN